MKTPALSPSSATSAICLAMRSDFSAYLDGVLSGVQMQAIAAHLGSCKHCHEEFAGLREMQSSLAALGPARMPGNLQSRLYAAIAAERERGTHLPLYQRFARFWSARCAPIAMRMAAGTAAALVMVGGASLLLGTGSAVEANDEPLGAITAPHYLYSEVPPQPIDFGHEAPVLVQAKIGEDGRVYDYAIVSGPTTPNIARRVEANLLASRFRPATIFGVAVHGTVLLTYSGVSVRG